MEPLEAQPRSRSNGLCECLVVALALYALVPRDAAAGDQPQSRDTRRNADTQKAVRAQIAAPAFPTPFAFPAPPEMPAFSPTEFRPRKPGLLEEAAGRSEGTVIDAPMLRDISIARELSEAKTQDRLRLLTLWQSRASSLYLQAGKRGAPSLQWSTPWMHRGTAARGLFDQLLPIAPHGFGSGGRSAVSRQAGSTTPGKAFDLSTPLNTP